MTVIFRTANGWLVRSHSGFLDMDHVDKVYTFHNEMALISHLQQRLGLVTRDAKGHFRSTKKKEPNAK